MKKEIEMTIKVNVHDGSKDENGKMKLLLKQHVGEITNDKNETFDLATSWTLSSLMIQKENSKITYCITFSDFFEALEKASLV